MSLLNPQPRVTHKPQAALFEVTAAPTSDSRPCSSLVSLAHQKSQGTVVDSLWNDGTTFHPQEIGDMSEVTCNSPSNPLLEGCTAVTHKQSMSSLLPAFPRLPSPFIQHTSTSMYVLIKNDHLSLV